MMVRFKEMLIDTPYPVLDIEDRGPKKDPSTSECTYCRQQGLYVRYDARDIVVVRRWKRRSVWIPDMEGPGAGGRFEWRCPDHPFDYSSSPYASEAPEHLRPTPNERCQEVTLGSRCRNRTAERYEGRWLCVEHSKGIVERLRVEERLQELNDAIS